MSGIPRLRATVICEAEGHLLLVRMRDPKTGLVALYPPGGGIEPGETLVQTAERETLEEAGVRVRVDPKLELVDRYPFTWNGDEYDCTTHYFGAQLEGAFVQNLPPVVDTEYNLGPTWVPSDEGLAQLEQFPRICTAVRRVLGHLRRDRWRRDPKVLASHGSMLLMIHDHFRVSAERLIFLLDDAATLENGWLARSFRPLAEMLHHHHHLEEVLIFNRIDEGPALTAEHEALTAAIAAADETFRRPGPDTRAILARFNAILVDHLDREEAIIVPYLAAMPANDVAELFGG